MITGIFHDGSGLGNQLHRYVFTRVKALDLGVDFGMEGEFKGKDFMDIDMGKPPEAPTSIFIEERKNTHAGVDIREYDPKTEQIGDNTKVDGEFQAEKYFNHRLDEVREWLKVEPLDIPDDLCVINFRGGEYAGISELFLPQEYWDEAVAKMRKINPDMKFVVHTDDPYLASCFFPEFECIKDMALNWRSIRYAKYLILSNSSFAIFPALLGDAKEIIAPFCWAGRNVGYWKLPQNCYKRFYYI